MGRMKEGGRGREGEGYGRRKTREAGGRSRRKERRGRRRKQESKAPEVSGDTVKITYRLSSYLGGLQF